MVFGESAPALLTTEALKAVAVFAEFLAEGVAVVTGHCSLASF